MARSPRRRRSTQKILRNWRVWAVVLFVAALASASIYVSGAWEPFIFSSASAGDAPIGFIGCSNSRDAVDGYGAVGGAQIWHPLGHPYGGGTVLAWGEGVGNPSSKYWKGFDEMRAANPGTQTIWWSMCTHPWESDAENYSAALAIREELERRIPGTTVYVSALNGYVPPHVCGLTGVDGPARMQALADRLVHEGRALPGPDVGDLISVYKTPSVGATATNNETVEDGCHPNVERGEPKLGRTLLSFFDGGDAPPTPPPPPPPPPPVPVKPACSDGKDNDADGKIDLKDAGCKSADDNDETNVVTPPPPPPKAETLEVSLAARPTSGPPLRLVDLKAVVSGSARGTVNYYFYCNRPDAGTNITRNFAAKFTHIDERRQKVLDVCTYKHPGTYTAKVIVERGGAAAEARLTISVEQ
jgi:hypothetical protein